MSGIPSLKELCVRHIAIRLFQVNIRWRKVRDVAFTLRDTLTQWSLPPHIKRSVRAGLAEVFCDVKRWDEKHKELFVKTKAKRAMDKEEHLRMFHNFLIWKYPCYVIDDCATARRLIITECKDWPQLQFQFACLYAITEWVENGILFDKYRRATFKRQLADHPVYEFWLVYLESNRLQKEVFFDTITRTANQKLQLCFQFAIRFGYYQLVQFIWNRITDATREYIGFLQWRSLCFRASDRDTMKFLCQKLCEMNAVGISKITFNIFWTIFHNTLHKEESDVVIEEKFKHRITFLLDNCCPQLRRRLLSMENYSYSLKQKGKGHSFRCRFISDAYYYNRSDLHTMLFNYMDADQKSAAAEILGKRRTRAKA